MPLDETLLFLVSVNCIDRQQLSASPIRFLPRLHLCIKSLFYTYISLLGSTSTISEEKGRGLLIYIDVFPEMGEVFFFNL